VGSLVFNRAAGLDFDLDVCDSITTRGDLMTFLLYTPWFVGVALIFDLVILAWAFGEHRRNQ
jgi:hypothetical protein